MEKVIRVTKERALAIQDTPTVLGTFKICRQLSIICIIFEIFSRTSQGETGWARTGVLVGVLSFAAIIFFLVLTVWVMRYRRKRADEGLLLDNEGTMLRHLNRQSGRLGATANFYDRVQFQRLIDE